MLGDLGFDVDVAPVFGGVCGVGAEAAKEFGLFAGGVVVEIVAGSFDELGLLGDKAFEDTGACVVDKIVVDGFNVEVIVAVGYGSFAGSANFVSAHHSLIALTGQVDR